MTRSEPNLSNATVRLAAAAACGIALLIPAPVASQESPGGVRKQLRSSLLFHASFDKGTDADFAYGDRRMYTTESTNRSSVQAGLHSENIDRVDSGGRYGGMLSFKRKGRAFPFYRGRQNIAAPSADQPFSGTVSFWMQLDPARELPKGYVDPIQITDKKWNDAAFFVDFTQENPRDFRLGAYSDYRVWNPQGLKYDDVPERDRPLIPVKKLPFAADKWTHVCFVWRSFNRDVAGEAVLYLNGQPQGVLSRPQRFSWDPNRVGIMLGINYVGRMDDLAVFSAPLSREQIAALKDLPGGVAVLHQTGGQR